MTPCIQSIPVLIGCINHCSVCSACVYPGKWVRAFDHKLPALQPSLSLLCVCVWGRTAVPVELLSLSPSNPVSYLMLYYVIILIDLSVLWVLPILLCCIVTGCLHPNNNLLLCSLLHISICTHSLHALLDGWLLVATVPAAVVVSSVLL